MSSDELILRYDNPYYVVTPFNPIEDLVSWISGLSSSNYVSEILHSVHGVNDKRDIVLRANSIAVYARNAVGLIEEAYSGPAEISFLPLFYSIQNISKIYIIIAGRGKDLTKNKTHGASYDPLRKKSRELRTEEVTVWRHGVLPLFYEVLTNDQWGQFRCNVEMRDIYPFITNISHEYIDAFKEPTRLQSIDLYIQQTKAGEYILQARLGDCDHPNAGNLKYLKLVKGFRRDPSNKNILNSPKKLASTIEEARNSLIKGVRRFLIYHSRYGTGEFLPMTPLSARRMLLPEELPIWIAFFHLSSIVRYNPEFLAQLMDSESWPMLLALRKHSIYKYLQLFWSYLHQRSYTFVIG
jgi:hypothetical protein